MDILFIRTKLQAHIAKRLIDEGKLSKRFILVKNYWRNLDEDSTYVYQAYEEISNKSIFSTYFIENSGFLKNTIYIFALSLVATFSGGRFLFAGINLYPFAIVKLLNPFLKINTFDDGSANIRPLSIYFKEDSLPDQEKLSRRIINYLFPSGASFYMRQKSLCHYTIYEDKANIVPKSKTQFIEMDWKSMLLESDEQHLSSLNMQESLNILLGTDEYSHDISVPSFLRECLEINFDLLILHPRDNSILKFLPNAAYFQSLAESIIFYLLDEPVIKRINLYHFNSSVIESIPISDKINSINLVNQLKEFKTGMPSQRNLNEDILVFVDTHPHLNFVKTIEKSFPLARFYLVTTSKNIYLRLNPSRDLYLKNKRAVKKFAFENKNSFDAIMAARVDDLNFQHLYRYLKKPKIYTFDEGLFTVQSDSIYNSQFRIKRDSGIKSYISSKLVNFPKPAAYFYQHTELHFTYFNQANFRNSIIDDRKLCYIPQIPSEKGITSIFIGQPWHFMGLNSGNINMLANYINNISPEVYLIHPRENINIIDHLINPEISRIRCESSSENFLNMLITNRKLKIFTVASTILIGLSKNVEIRIITSSSFPENVKFGQQNLLSVLREEKTDYEVTDI